LGAEYNGKKIGSISDLTTFSFHPVKTITTGEGGAVLTNDEVKYRFMKKFVTHGLTKEQFVRPSSGPWYMEMAMLGQNYRLTDIQCALGISQLKKVDRFVDKRRLLVKRYNEAFINTDLILPPADTVDIRSAWHLYVISFPERLVSKKAQIVEELRSQGILVQVHHIPIHTDPYYKSLGYNTTMPNAETWYESALSLPLFPGLTTVDQDKVISAIREVVDEQSVWFFKPDDAESLAHVITQALADPDGENRVARALQTAERYSWKGRAEKIITALV
jgi:dTDP-4-amino-4,6-dideoxygalactose transaminase